MLVNALLDAVAKFLQNTRDVVKGVDQELNTASLVEPHL